MPRSFEDSRPWNSRVSLPFAGVLLGGLFLLHAAAASGVSGARSSASNTRPDSYALSMGDNQMSTNVSLEECAGLREQRSDDFLWFHRAGKAYWILDHATLVQARSLFAPLRALRPEYENLRRRQEALERKERELDRQEEDLDLQVDQMTDGEGDEGDDGDNEDVEEIAQPPDANREELERQLAELQGRQRGLQARLRGLESDDRELEKLERSLDAREDALEREAEGKLWALIDAAVKKGLARAAPEP